MESNESASLFDIQLDQPSVSYLTEAAKWARFLSILGFIYCGFMIILAVFFGSIVTKMMAGSMSGDAAAVSMMGSGFFGSIFIVMSLIMFFPAWYLYNFATKLRRAIRLNEQSVLVDSMKNLKSFFKFYGIFAIIVLSFYLLALIAAVAGGLMAGH